MGKTLLIGLDGATFTIIDPLMRRGLMPFLRDFVSGGVRASLRSVMPPLTPPGWTSLMTGKRPGRHGVFDFFQKQEPHSRYFRLATSHDIQSATIWSLASDYGVRVLALNFPMTFPPPAVNGCVVPGGWMPWRQFRLGCYPAGLFDRLRELPSFSARELALDMAFEEKAIEGCAAEEYADWITLHTRREWRWFEVARYLMREEPADLVGIVFDGVDKLQHLCWRFLDPACQSAHPTSWEREITALCERYFRQLDQFIAGLVDLAGPQARVVLASDHGAGPVHDIFYVNTWLEQQGYLAWADEAAAPQEGHPGIGLRHITRHVHELDWERTVAYAATPSSQGIHIVTRTSGSGAGVPPEDYARVREELAGALRRARHPATGRPIVSEVWAREEAFAGPYQALAPDLSIMLNGGGVVSILRADRPLQSRAEPRGSHRWEGVFLARGPGIRAGATLGELAIVDVAPLLLYLAGLPLPGDVDGRLPVEALEAAEIERRRPLVKPTSPAERAPAPTVAYDAEAETAVVERLRALGYVD